MTQPNDGKTTTMKKTTKMTRAKPGSTRAGLKSTPPSANLPRETETPRSKLLNSVSTLRPGLLVSLKTSVRGNCSYVKRDLEAKKVKTGEDVSKWETTRTISDPVEHEAAHKARGKARTALGAVCSHTAFGLLCPEDRADELEQAMAEARRIADEFNSTAKITRLYVNVMTGRIAPDDVEAIRSINSEVRDLLDDMKEGLENLDVKAVREAAGRARSLGQMLTQDAQVRIQFAIDAARAQATKIVKAGEQAAIEIDRRTIATLSEARTAFLDLDDAKEIVRPAASARSVDFVPDDEPKVKRPRARQQQLELGE